jgi:hypothetical protein
MDNLDSFLPESVCNKASKTNNEYAWKIADVDEALSAAATANLACCGYDVTFRFEEGICELYWLSYLIKPKQEDESWKNYSQRTIKEVREYIHQVHKETDFWSIAREWPFVNNKIENEGINPCDYLYFHPCFELEREILPNDGFNFRVTP